MAAIQDGIGKPETNSAKVQQDMEANSLKIAKVFSGGGAIHYVLPHFQREYAWEKKQWETLLKDVVGVYQVYSEDAPPEHFMGTLVVINDRTAHGVIPVFRLVDGQQRLTTISLMLCALGRLVSQTQPALSKKIRRLLLNEDEENDLQFKLLPTTKYGDRRSYQAIVRGRSIPSVESKIPEAFSFFQQEFGRYLTNGEIEPEKLFIVLINCLQVVFIELNNNERPYEIFESLNSKGRHLTPADLVRNYIAMKLPQGDQAFVFEEYWSPIEEMLQEKRTVGKSGLGELTAFLRHYIACLNGVLVNEEHVYSRFRDRGQSMSTEKFIEEMRVLKRFAGYYDRMLRPEKEPHKALREQLQRLNRLEFATAYPFLLSAYNAIDNGHFSSQDLAQGLATLESYMVRRYLTRDTVGYINRMFPTLWKEVDTSDFNASLRRAIAAKNFPNDDRLREALEANELYKRDREKLVLVLETINRHLSKGTGGITMLDGKATLEHIMPQSLSEEWQHYLGSTWAEDYYYLHTIGNLTLVTQEWNSSMSNAPYPKKKELLGQHALKLNSSYFANGPKQWNGTTILERSQLLADIIIQIWPAPEAIKANKVWRERPKALSILGKTYETKSWRDIVQYTAETIAQTVPDFEATIASQFPKWFSKSEMERSRLLSNGWWVYVNFSGEGAQGFIERMAEMAGIPEEQLQLIW